MAYEASPREEPERRSGARFEEGYSRGRPRDFDSGYRDNGYPEKRLPRDYPEDAPRPRRPREYPVDDRDGRDRYAPPQRYDDRRPRGGSGGPGSFRYRDDYMSSRGGFDRRTGYDRNERGRGRGFAPRGFRRGGMDRGLRRERTPPDPNRVLGVFGLSPRTEERDLYEVFSEFGRVDDIQMVFDSLTGRSRGFGFIYFEDIDSAIAAREGLSRGLELHGRVVRIDYSKTEGAHAPTPGVFMGKNKDGRGYGRGGGSFSRPYGRTDYAPRGRYAGGGGYRSRSRSRSRSYSMSPRPGGPRPGARPPVSRMSRSRSRSPPGGVVTRHRPNRVVGGDGGTAAAYDSHVNGGSSANPMHSGGGGAGGCWTDGSQSPL